MIDRQVEFRKFLESRRLSKGLGSRTSPCSIAALNLFLRNCLTDHIPRRTSMVIGRWVIPVQDSMPDEMLNSPGWKDALAGIIDTGREQSDEAERIEIVLGWVWGTVLPVTQAVADQNGFGSAWRRMLRERTKAAVLEATMAARVEGKKLSQAAKEKEADDAVEMWSASGRIMDAAMAADLAALDGGVAAHAKQRIARPAVMAVERAALAAYRAAAALGPQYDGVWSQFDPPGLLAKLVTVK